MKNEKVLTIVLAFLMLLSVIFICRRCMISLTTFMAENANHVEKQMLDKPDIGLGYTPPPKSKVPDTNPNDKEN